MRDTGRWVELGVIGRPHGVRGAMRAFLHNRDSDLLASLETLHLKKKGDDLPREVGIRGFAPGPKALILELDGVDHRDQAQAFSGATIFVERSMLPEAEDEEFYVQDLMGVKVVDGDAVLGEIVSSRAQGGIEVVTVRGEEHEVEVPLVEDYVEELRISEGLLRARDTSSLPRSRARKRKDG